MKHLLLTTVVGLLMISCSEPNHDAGIEVPNFGTDKLVYEEKALEILRVQCWSCHNEATRSGGFGSISNRDTLLSSGKIVKGQSEISPLFQRVASGSMPPGNPLSLEDINTIARWIDEDLAIPNESIDTAIRYEINVRPILERHCISCHGSSGENFGSINLQTYSNVLEVVEPGFPEGSLIFDSIWAGRMPKSGSSVSQDDLETLYEWILNGVQE